MVGNQGVAAPVRDRCDWRGGSQREDAEEREGRREFVMVGNQGVAGRRSGIGAIGGVAPPTPLPLGEGRVVNAKTQRIS